MKISACGANPTGLNRLAKAGFNACDFNVGWYFSSKSSAVYDIYNLTDQDIIDYFTPLRKLADELGIEIYQTHGLGCVVVDDFEGGIKEYADRARATYLASKVLGAKYCVQHPSFDCTCPYDINRKRSIEHMLMAYSACNEALEEFGIVCCIENMHHTSPAYRHRAATSLSRTKDMAERCDTLGKNFGVCLDVGHCTVTGDDPIEAVYILGDRLKVLHTHDNDGMWDLHQFPYVPQGKAPSRHPLSIDWEAFMKALADVGYEGSLSFETSAPCPAPIADSAYKYLAAIGRYLVSRYDFYKGK